ncbi:hypothetical protein VTH06DRAFT_8274 [Thermothelomyces fergusii]
MDGTPQAFSQFVSFPKPRSIFTWTARDGQDLNDDPRRSAATFPRVGIVACQGISRNLGTLQGRGPDRGFPAAFPPASQVFLFLCVVPNATRTVF